MKQQLTQIAEQLAKLQELVAKMSDNYETGQAVIPYEDNDIYANQKGMRQNHLAFFRALYEKFGKNEFSADHQFIFLMAYKCGIPDLRETMLNVAIHPRRAFIEFNKVRPTKTAKHLTYKFIKIIR